MDYALVSFMGEDGASVGVLFGGSGGAGGDQLVDARAVIHKATGEQPSMTAVLDHWQELEPQLKSFAFDAQAGRASRPIARAGVRLLPPLPRPRNIYCAFANYSDHMQEMGGQPADKSSEDPFLFLVPATAVIGPEQPIRLPAGFSRVDWEAELAAVIGRPARNLSPSEALSCVAGYTILNDVSARGGARRGANGGRPDFLSSKGRESFKPMGPALVPAEFIPDPQTLSIRLWVSGVLKQDSNTARMIFSTAELISFASHAGTLQPGDVFATGTPAGVGMPRGTFLKPGDDVRIEIEALGTLHNPVVGD